MLTKRQIRAISSDLGDGDAGFSLAFQALGDPGRCKIFRLLAARADVCVTDVANIFGISVSAASQQLRVLERVGLVTKTRTGQTVCYEIHKTNPIATSLLRLLQEPTA